MTTTEVDSIKRTISMQMNLLKEVYVHLQGFSSYYPYLDHFTVREHFLKKANLGQNGVDVAAFDAILKKADHSSR